jgi:UTP--glucose-1-phosphate uridylyltransferase
MLPLIDKPLVQYVVEEAVASGIEQILFITGRGKRAIEDHFDFAFELESMLYDKGKDLELHQVRRPAELAKFFFVRQKEALGLGHAILCAKEFVGDDPFAVLLGDDIVDAEPPCLAQLLEVYQHYASPVLALKQVPMENISSYGCVRAEQLEGTVHQVIDLVEKPARSEAPSDLAIIGRYILTPRVFDFLERLEPGKGGEIQLTDAIKQLAQESPIYGCRFEGLHHDCGDKLGFLKATVDMALKREEFNGAFEAFLRERLGC